MYTLLILFFGSLVSIVVMIGRKLVLLKNGQTLVREEIVFEIPHLEKVKHLTVQNIKKYGHLTLVEILRFYVRSSSALKSKYQELKIKMEDKLSKNQNGSPDGQKANKFLKMISDYKHKIREIKHKIREEENL